MRGICGGICSTPTSESHRQPLQDFASQLLHSPVALVQHVASHAQSQGKFHLSHCKSMFQSPSPTALHSSIALPGCAGQHHGERHNLIARLQNLAKAKNVRVSFVGGDVHVAGVGRLYTQPKIHRLRHDHRFMPQVTCPWKRY